MFVKHCDNSSRKSNACLHYTETLQVFLLNPDVGRQSTVSFVAIVAFCDQPLKFILYDSRFAYESLGGISY